MIAAPIQIRFADVDMAGHVHNAAYLHYFESARLAFFMKGLGTSWDWKKTGFILKKNTVEYHQPIYLPEKISIEVSTAPIGTKSFTLHYKVMDHEGAVKATGESVIVCMDYLENKTIPIPAPVLNLLNGHR